jgi:hypothetical protein
MIPYGAEAVGCTTAGHHHIFLLYASAASGSSATVSPTVWKLPHSLTEQRLKIYNDSSSRNLASVNPNQSLHKYFQQRYQSQV